MTVIQLHTMTPVDDRPPVVLCLGNFDGVHRGHAALIEATCRHAQQLRMAHPDVRSGAWCFAVPPRRYLPAPCPPQITSLREKLEHMARLGLEYAYLTDFRALRDMSPEAFIREHLMAECHAVATVCGFNHRFGGGGRGMPSDLEAAFGDHALTLPPVGDAGQGVVISSSHIRTLLCEGDMAGAVRLLGHPFVLRAPVVHGKALGRTIGLPTANQFFPATHLIPAHGIYATRIRLDGCSYIGVTNVGKRPTVHDGDFVNSETYILDFNGSLYGRVIEVEFYHRLRDERRFPDLSALTAAIRADAQHAREFFAQQDGGHA